MTDLGVGSTDRQDLAQGNPGMAEAMIRLYTAYREAQLALADRGENGSSTNPLDEVRAFLAARQNYFPVLDDRAEKLARSAHTRGGLSAHLESEHGYAVRRLPGDIMHGAVRRLDLHRRELALDDGLDGAGTQFQIALQLAYLELGEVIDSALTDGQLTDESSMRISRRALANYAAGAMLMPYEAFFREAERTGYDIEALSRHFGTSFEQTAHRLTTLQKPSAKGVPFFFIRVDAAGNVSKRLDGGTFPFARHGGSCPLWSLHDTFRRRREVLTEVLELPGGERFFSIARSVTAGGGAWQAPRITRAIALGCDIKEAERLVYAKDMDLSSMAATPIGVTCRLCQRADCAARAEPPMGRQLLADDYRRLTAPFGFADS
ncbi:MAG: short-chain fatty acyl-CoA regulator family protein [Pseudomonadota bacterium]